MLSVTKRNRFFLPTLLLYILMLPSNCIFAQCAELEISKGYSGYGPLPTYTFQSRFRTYTYIYFDMPKNTCYAQNKVKTLELVDNQDKLVYSAAFDTAGHLFSEGVHGPYYFIVTQRFRKNGDSIKVIQYFEEKQLVMIDSSFIRAYRYKSDDLTLLSLYTVTKVYKTGSLINQQNAHYNKVRQSRSALNSWIPVQKIWKEDFKTTYDSNTIYLSKVYAFSVTVETGPYMKTFPLLDSAIYAFEGSRHPKLLGYLTEGESYEEPVTFYQPMSCGTARWRESEEIKRTGYGYTRNGQGLYATYFSKQMQEDTKREPNIHTLYVFRYTYFE